MPYGISGGSDVSRVGGRAGTSSLRVQMGESMRQYIPVITLALLSALALAVVSGGLFPSDSAVHAAGSVQFTVPENTPPGTNVGAPVTASETVNTDDKTLVYSLDGSDKDSFGVDELTGQVITKAPLNYEDDNNRAFSFSVIATNAYNSDDEVDSTVVIVMVGDVEEPPPAPAAPTVTSGSNATSLVVHWDAPDVTGRPDIDGYDVEYKKATETDYTDAPHSGTGTEADISGLDAGTDYHVRVLAENDEGKDAWSLVGTGITNTADNSAPSFGSPTATINLAENTPAGQNVNAAVRATDNDSTTLVYSLEGRDADSFDIVSTSGQILTKSPLNYEGKRQYVVLVKVVDGDGGSAVASRTINVTNVNEPPSAPGKPTVVAGEDNESTDLPVDESATSLKVTWDAPVNMGPLITESDGNTSYTVEYRKGMSGSFTAVNSGIDKDKRSVTIEALDPGTSYQVRVKADNGEGDGSGWSETGTGSTNPANRAPEFSTGTVTRSVRENTPANMSISSPVRATDRDGDTIKYSLGGTHAEFFDINEATAQLLTKSPLNYEGACGDNNNDAVADASECTYSVTVTAEDENGTTATKDVTIEVQDIGEPPSAPDKPTVTSVDDDDNAENGDELTTKLEVRWAEAENTGPAITRYQVQYRSRGSFLLVPDSAINMQDRTVTITELTANTTYQVQVRAINDEGTGSWSASGTGKTSAGSENDLPAFDAGQSATLTLRENTTQVGFNIGGPLTVIDIDSTTFTYSLEGADADSFDIDMSTGQIKTKSGVTYDFESKRSYSLMVKVEDNHGGSSTIAVTINIEDDPNEAPETPAAPTVTTNEDDPKTANVDESTSTL